MQCPIHDLPLRIWTNPSRCTTVVYHPRAPQAFQALLLKLMKLWLAVIGHIIYRELWSYTCPDTSSAFI